VLTLCMFHVLGTTFLCKLCKFITSLTRSQLLQNWVFSIRQNKYGQCVL